MLEVPFYDPDKSYEENFQSGPYGAFADGEVFENSGEPQCHFFNIPVYSTFGIPAGPLVNANFCKSAFQKGFDICVYKTVRSEEYPCHPWPNVLPLNVEGDLTLEKLQSPVVEKKEYKEPLSITNSFGVPSRGHSAWHEDVKCAISYAGHGQVLVLSFMGTVREGQTREDFINDNILAAKLSFETGAKVLEINLSCPNIGNEGLVCYDLDITEEILKGVRSVIGATPLIMKVGYFKDNEDLEKLAKIADAYADSISSINTLQGTIVDENGDQALPGKMRLRGGICGAGIKWAGIDMVKRLTKIKKENSYSFSIEGVGGVMNSIDYKEYKDAGADAVMSATGAMWNTHLAQEIKNNL